MRIKPATSADSEAILKLMPVYYEFDHLIFDEKKARATLWEFLSSGEFGNIWLMMDHSGEQAIGYIMITFGYSMEYGGRVALIDELFVLEKHRGKGIGSQAIRHAQAECKKLGLKAIRLEVTKTNQAVINLYRKMGFEDLGRSLLTFMA